MSDLAEEVSGLLLRLPGVRAAQPLASRHAPCLLEAEERYESRAVLPVLNLGIRQALGRRLAVVILKDERFRPPASPTLYLVEDGGAPAGETLRIEDRTYHILGEESVGEAKSPASEGLLVSDTFSIFPERRTDPRRPSYFLLPPVPFPELEAPPWPARLGSVVSASPSPLGDAALRSICGFPEDAALATLVVGFDRASPG